MKTKQIVLLLLLAFCGYSTVSAQSLEGNWSGSLELGTRKLGVVLHLQTKNGGYVATMDSPDQNATGLLVDSVHFDGQRLFFALIKMKISYTGTLQKESGQIMGTFTQATHAFPLTLSRNNPGKKAFNRPQTPTAPFPYRSEEVKFYNSEDSVTLAGTLTLPSPGKPCPVVVLISGSGPQNRDEEVYEHKPFLVLADYLTRKGIAVLRFDDRGVGASTGNFKNATTANFAKDVQAAIAYLNTRPEIKKDKIGLIGHSEGGMIAPMVAATNSQVAFLVLMAAPGIPIADLLPLQNEKVAKLSGVKQEVIMVNNQLIREAHTILVTSHPTEIEANLRDHITRGLVKLPVEMRPKTDQEVAAFIQQQIKRLTNPWYQYFVRFEPAYYLQQVRCPVLAVNGSLDCQVPSKENLSGIAGALQETQNKNYKIVEIPGLNHLFQQAITGGPEEYATLEQTISPLFLEQMHHWIKRRIRD